MWHNGLLRTSFSVFFCGSACDVTSEIKNFDVILTARVSCLSPWARQNFQTPLKLEQTLSHTLLGKKLLSIPRVVDFCISPSFHFMSFIMLISWSVVLAKLSGDTFV